MIDIARVERQNEELYRRLRRLEMKIDGGEIPRSAKRAPEGSFIWHDVEAGKLMVWNGDGWDTFTKD